MGFTPMMAPPENKKGRFREEPPFFIVRMTRKRTSPTYRSIVVMLDGA